MKKLIASAALCVTAVALLGGCTGVTPMNGNLYTDVKGPVSMGTAATMPKMGTAQAIGIIGIATGDASIGAAMRNGGITKVHHVDTQVKNILGIYAEYTTVVYGE